MMDILERTERGLRAAADADEVFSIGESECGNPVLCVHKGRRDGAQIVVTAAIHARECYTALVVIGQASAFAGRGGGAYFIPLVNPDGALFFERGETFGREFLKRNRDMRRVWKANADGVDLNTNFDANWGSGAQNVRIAGASDYIGGCPLCAKESAALAEFTEKVKPQATVSYHCMGGELYWEFFQNAEARCRDERIAEAVAARIGVKKIDGDLHSAGGYKDFCIQKLGIPALTIELIRSGSHPFPPEAFAADGAKNRDLPQYLIELLNSET